MVREIIRDPIFLQQKSVPADRSDMETARDLKDTLAANSDRCVGMAANMIGVNKTILAALIKGKIVVMIDPVITDRSKQVYTAEEGCLSLTGTRTAVRHKVISVEFFDESYKKKKLTLRDFEAQIVQHEIDHFSGKLI
ncbi:MAG: peptide deformylase [Ruminococcus sp.]|nr:peptide deformylase [Ruminococcus sp.]